MSKRAALILSGGSARRFQTYNQPWQDKVLAELDGKPLLVYAIQNLQSVVDKVAVCVNDRERKAQYNQILEKHGFKGVRFVVDEKNCPVKGPLVAIMSGLHAVSAIHCLTVPADMPFLKPEVVDYMFNMAEGVDVAVPMWPDGTVETLLMALERRSGLEIADTLCALKKTRADSIIRGANKLLLVSPLKEIKALDPELRSFININSKEELTKLETRPIEGPATENITLSRSTLPLSDLRLLREGEKMLGESKLLEAQSTFAGCADIFESRKACFWAGVCCEKLGEAQLKQNASKAKESYLRGANNYQTEAESYAMKGCRLLAERALADKAWCQSQAKA